MELSEFDYEDLWSIAEDLGYSREEFARAVEAAEGSLDLHCVRRLWVRVTATPANRSLTLRAGGFVCSVDTTILRDFQGGYGAVKAAFEAYWKYLFGPEETPWN